MSSNSGYKSRKSRTHSSSSASGYSFKSKTPPPSLPPDMIAKIVGHASAVTNKSVIRSVSKSLNQDQYVIEALLLAPMKEKERVFIRACERGKLEYVKQLVIRGGVDPTILNNYAIRKASLYGHLDVVKFLASQKGVNPADKNNLAIVSASLHGHLDVVKFLASLKGVNPTDRNNGAIRLASRNGHLDVVKFLASLKGVNPTDVDNEAIRLAARANNSSIVRFLLKYVTNINDICKLRNSSKFLEGIIDDIVIINYRSVSRTSI